MAAKQCILAGCLSYFVHRSSLPNGAEDLASLHSAEPVKAGEKWIATR
jgi:hypothetical protein